MRKNIFLLGPAVVLCLCLLAPPTQAKSFRVGLFGNLGYGFYGMDDVNQDLIQPLNDMTASLGGTRINKITGGGGGNLGVKFLFLNHLLAGASLGYLGAGTHADLSLLGANAGTIDIFLPALEEGVFLKGAWFVGKEVMLNAGGELDYLTLIGMVNATSSSSSSRNTWTGMGVGAKLTAGAEFFLGDHWALTADLGYRFARILEIQDQNSVRIVANNGNNFTVDYSGPFIQGGVSVYF